VLLTKRAKLVNKSFYSPIDYLANSSVQMEYCARLLADWVLGAAIAAE
jgi:hypothetical protein